MNGDRQMEMHYINTGFPYTVTESFMDFFEGLTHAPTNYAQPGMVPDQESIYWSMSMNSYKFGMSEPGSTSYYAPYEVNDHLPRIDANRMSWVDPSTVVSEESPINQAQLREDTTPDAEAVNEECIPDNQSPNDSEVVWQDDIDPDNMTYEELLELGEAVGTQSRGLSEDLISLLPKSKYKFGNLFSRKKSGERCVICQMKYKRGDQQVKLPCKHVYHSECITKWLTISKICPVCNVEVFGEI